MIKTLEIEGFKINLSHLSKYAKTLPMKDVVKHTKHYSADKRQKVLHHLEEGNDKRFLTGVINFFHDLMIFDFHVQPLYIRSKNNTMQRIFVTKKTYETIPDDLKNFFDYNLNKYYSNTDKDFKVKNVNIKETILESYDQDMIDNYNHVIKTLNVDFEAVNLVKWTVNYEVNNV